MISKQINKYVLAPEISAPDSETALVEGIWDETKRETHKLMKALNIRFFLEYHRTRHIVLRP